MTTKQLHPDAALPPREVPADEEHRSPEFRDLTPGECIALLTRHNVGRIAYTFHDRVGIEPIHYVYDNGWLYGRTSHGSKLDTLAHHPWIAFEVDEIEGLFDWRSVEVRGTFYRAEADGPVSERDAREHAIALLTALVPGTMTRSDPVAFRNVVFRIHLDEVTGREARSRGSTGDASP